MQIGNLKLENNIFLAPMAGVTDITFRIICKKAGCGLTYTEMITARGMFHKNKRTARMLEILPEEKPVAIQLYGSEPEIIARACEKLNENSDICLIDINMGCPTKKIVRRGEGVALMKNPKLAVDIIREAKKVTNKPVTAKIRKGFDVKSINAIDFAKKLEGAGVDAITIHGRTGAQKYEGTADWDIIKEIKKIVKIPVIGNGGIFSASDAVRMFHLTGCDGIMVARGAIGHPWIFREINQALKGEEMISFIENEQIMLFNEHLERTIKCYGEYHGRLRMQRHIRAHKKSYSQQHTKIPCNI
ncbi:MAG: tRNA dihydrouridine synthase DusB [bacterium]|nr:tRNA dihydrouridine synthase DusB [bacterium]